MARTIHEEENPVKLDRRSRLLLDALTAKMDEINAILDQKLEKIEAEIVHAKRASARRSSNQPATRQYHPHSSVSRDPRRNVYKQEHPQETIEQKKTRVPFGQRQQVHTKQRSSEKTNHLQEKIERQEFYEDMRKLVLESFNSVTTSQKKKSAPRHTTEKEKLKCSKETSIQGDKEPRPSSSYSEPSQVEKHTPLLKASSEAKCDFPLHHSDFVLDKLTPLEPVQPSRIVSISQVLQEEPQEEPSAETESGSLEEDAEPTQLVPKPALISFPCDNPRKHCKEIELVRNGSDLFIKVSVQDEKCFGLESIKEFCVSNTAFDRMIPNFETSRFEECIKPKGYLLDMVHELKYFSRVAMNSTTFDMSRTITDCATIRASSKIKQNPKNMFCALNINIFSSIMHLSLPKENDAGSKRKLEELLVIRPKKQQFIFDPGTFIETCSYEQGKEIIVADTIIPRYVSLLTESTALLKLEHTRMFSHLNNQFEYVFSFCEELERKKKFRNGGFIFDKSKLSEPSCSLLNYVVISIDRTTRADEVSNINELFIENPAEHVNLSLVDLSENSPTSRYDYISCTLDLLPRVLAVSIQDVELNFHAPKTWLFHVWLKKMVVQVIFKPKERANAQDSSMIREEPPDPTPLPLMLRSCEQFQDPIQVSDSLTLIDSHALGTTVISSLHSENIERRIACVCVYYDSMTLLIHLLFAKGVEVIAGIKDKPPNTLFVPQSHHNHQQTSGWTLAETSLPISYEASLKRPRRTTKREEDNRFKPPDLDQDKHQDVRRLIVTKEAPPDATYKPKLNLNRFPGKYHKSSSFNVTNLVSFCAEETDLRSNPFQVGEDDVIMTSKETIENEENQEQLEPELSKIDLRSNPLQVGEDDVIMTSHETMDHKEDQEQLVAEETKEKEGDLGQLTNTEPKEIEDKDLDIPPGVLSRSNTQEFHQAFHWLLLSIQGNLEFANPITLVEI